MEERWGQVGCDREVFAQVWGRVDPGPGCPVEVEEASAGGPESRGSLGREGLAAMGEPPGTVLAAVPAGFGCFEEMGGESSEIRPLVDVFVIDSLEYRRLAEMMRRQGELLRELERGKLRGAKRLSAAYFLITGVRYWPKEALSGLFRRAGAGAVREDSLGTLRRLFWREQDRARTLEALGDKALDPCLMELYRSLAEEARGAVYTLKRMVERGS